MEKTLPLYLGPSVIGSLIARQEGLYTYFFAKTYTSHEGLLRAYVRGHGGTLLVGVLSPDGAAFSAKKTVSETALLGTGLTFEDITYAFVLSDTRLEDELPDKWERLSDFPEVLSGNKILCALAKSQGTLSNDSNSPTKLAIPLLTKKPFPRPDVLCLLTPCEISGELYGIIGISENGEPVRT
ncbi:MAG: hypothetical protein IKU65_06720 [Oscillospiraceae bacterium]|nr:hypothetical protein [Oscillospiraceae bacterium]